MGFLADPAYAIYMALAVALAVWLGIFAFLWRIDRQAQELRRRLDQAPQAAPPDAPRATLEARPGHELRRPAPESQPVSE